MGLDKAINTDLSAAEKFNLTIEISRVPARLSFNFWNALLDKLGLIATSALINSKTACARYGPLILQISKVYNKLLIDGKMIIYNILF